MTSFFNRRSCPWPRSSRSSKTSPTSSRPRRKICGPTKFFFFFFEFTPAPYAQAPRRLDRRAAAPVHRALFADRPWPVEAGGPRRACRPSSAYRLRNKAGAESFARAWDHALFACRSTRSRRHRPRPRGQRPRRAPLPQRRAGDGAAHPLRLPADLVISRLDPWGRSARPSAKAHAAATATCASRRSRSSPA